MIMEVDTTNNSRHFLDSEIGHLFLTAVSLNGQVTETSNLYQKGKFSLKLVMESEGNSIDIDLEKTFREYNSRLDQYIQERAEKIHADLYAGDHALKDKISELEEVIEEAINKVRYKL